MPEERRLVTILFADVVGSTSLGESVDPEDMRALLARLFAIASDAIEQRGGRVEKFIGDAIMAVFGLPVAHDDDPARALSAALNLRDRVRDDPALGERIAIRLGVNSGEVIATRDADASQFLVTGDPVNTAARLQSGADAWGILVGERTAAAAGSRFEFGPPIEVEAKGKARPVPARELLGMALEPEARGRGRIVGREADLEQLALTGRRAFDERRPFLISVVAPAGVGKSRLLEEFLDRLDPGVQVAIAQCLPYGQLLTYWPMRSILLSIIGQPDDATPEQVRAAVLAWIREAGDADAETTAELLSATIGASEAETSDRLALFAAWRRFIELAAEKAPLVLVIEDLHWSSDSLLDLIETILQPKADVPLLMVALARPELLDRRPTWGGGRRNAISISLEPLPDRAVAELVTDLLPDATPEIVAAVVDRAEGNPFYAGEIVRSLIDRLGAVPDP
ncbi:MAG TPA: adenylate/guanylate cyclase domain-containing protein, partial [Candidatus Limnocylindrales bacterium]